MSSLYEYYNTGQDGTDDCYDSAYHAMTFTPQINISAEYVKLLVNKEGVPGDVTVSIKATDGDNHPVGDDLASVTVASSTIGISPTWVTFTFDSAVNLIRNTVYAIIVKTASGNQSNAINWARDSSSPTYTRGNAVVFTGGDWVTVTRDELFEVWGISSPPVYKTYSKALVAIGGSEFWYESSAGTMEELAAANQDINTTLQLEAIEAFQKIFIVNKTNLKVADFVNTKITTADILPADKVIPLKGDILEATAGAASGAKMIVDYIDATDGACNIYGYRITVATFADTDVVTGTNDNGDISFTLNAAETAPPHWYSWTVYSSDATNYGTMPTSASLITLYRGRVVINDVQRPHAWYMFRVDNPWKVKYDYDNDGDLSAVTHANSEVGEVGDIITALISYKDDLIIFGCVNSVWILVGDPMGSGQLARVTGNTGIWGSRAWCIDDSNNLYFLGNDGLYRMLISESFSPPENISKLNLPNLMKDLDLDKSLHRVVLSFDPINFGILISKTTLADGSNTDYFFSLLTQGFYPEDYPDSCGIFSSYFYSATDDTYKKFLVGCDDGYIREFDNSTKSDIETDDSETAIDSYFTVINKLSEDEDTEGRMNWLNAITAGGASGGDFSDSDSVDFSAFIGDNAETVLEDIIDGAATLDWATGQNYIVGDLRIYNHIEYISLTIHTSVAGGGVDGYGEPDTNTTDWSPVAFISGTWDGTGKQTKNRIRMRGYWFGLKLRNRTSDETFAMDKIYADIKPIKKER